MEKRQKGENHLSLCIERYRRQIKKKRYFLHEHPAGADSWDEEEMQRLSTRTRCFHSSWPDVCMGHVHPCQAGKGVGWSTRTPSG